MLYRFILGGYYSMRHRVSNESNQTVLHFVVLNTVMFQPQYADYFSSNDAAQQIEYASFHYVGRSGCILHILCDLVLLLRSNQERNMSILRSLENVKMTSELKTYRNIKINIIKNNFRCFQTIS